VTSLVADVVHAQNPAGRWIENEWSLILTITSGATFPPSSAG
jgi:hypothetical protein